MKASPRPEPLPVFDEREAESLAKAAMISRTGEFQVFPAQARAPYRRAQDALLDALTPEVLASLPLGQHVVFATNPNPMQRPFPKRVDQVVTDLRQQMEVLGKVVRSQPDWKPEYTGQWPFYLMVLPESRTPAKSVVSVVREPSYILMKPMILDQQGLAVSAVYDNDSRSILTRHVLTSPARKDLPDTPIELSQESIEWVRMANTAYGPYQFDGTALAAMLRRCDKHDPLKLVFGEGAKALSRATGRPIVLALTDGSLQDVRASSRAAKFTVRSFRRMLDSGGSGISERGGWDIGLQSFPGAIPYERMDRKAVVGFSKLWDRDQVATLEASAELVAKQPFGCWLLLRPILNRIGPAIGATQQCQALLRVFALASPSQKAALRSGRTILFQELTREQQKAVHQGAFLQYWDTDVTYAGGLARPEGRDGGSWVPGWKDEITEMLPNGIREDAPVSLLASSSELALLRRDNGVLILRDDDYVSSSVASARKGGFESKLAFKMVTRNRFDLCVGLIPHVTKHFTFDESRIPQSEWLTFGQLPEAYRKRIEEGVRTYGSDGRVAPPPPVDDFRVSR